MKCEQAGATVVARDDIQEVAIERILDNEDKMNTLKFHTEM